MTSSNLRLSRLNRNLLSVLAIFLSAVSLIPLGWALSLSLKSNSETVGGTFLPAVPQFDNYLAAWNEFALGQFFVNSIVVTSVSVTITIVAGLAGAYAFTAIRFRGSETLFTVLLLGVVVPPAALIVPLLIQMRTLGLYNSHAGLALAYVALGLPIATLIFRGYLTSIPREIYEAARLDGAGELRILFRIVVPLSKSAIATVAILLFLVNWNEFILALVLLRDTEQFTLPVGIASQIGQYTAKYNYIAAASIISAIPIFVLYLTLQRHFEKGVAEGAIKM
ncbi:carbohydrate ABC transporter permease [Gemmatimonas sp.]|uniref:carbohydrate ABC transporter permease n=1 Tax=Gemmatimonas sp. TaxID=1962908 RepID=UPI003566F7D1